MFPGTLGVSQSGLMDPLQMAAFNNLARLPTDQAMTTAPNVNMGGGMGAGGVNGMGFGANLPTAQLALNGLGSLASIFAGFKQLSLANKQFKYTKKVTDTNLGNQIQTYNTALADRANARHYTQNISQDQANAYIADNRLKEYKG